MSPPHALTYCQPIHATAADLACHVPSRWPRSSAVHSEPVVRWLLESSRCETAVADAAGYAARLAARHSADSTVERISEMMQCYLVSFTFVVRPWGVLAGRAKMGYGTGGSAVVRSDD